MNRYAVAFVTPEGKLIHNIIEAEDNSGALRTFFDANLTDQYSNDKYGFHYFKEDFSDKSSSSGSLIEL